MNLKKTVITGVTALTLTAGAFAAQTPAPAQGGQDCPCQGKGRHGMMGKRMGQGMKRGMFRMGAALNLTDTQKQYARDLFTQNREANKAVRDQLRQNRQQLQAAIQSNNEVEINRLTAEQAQLKSQVAASRAKAMAKFWAQLTPEQKAKAEELRKTRQERMQQRMNRGQGPAVRG